MNESVIIISCIVIIVFSSVYLLWKIGEYLYEVLVEKFTVDPDPANPEQPQKSEWGKYWESLKPSISSIIDQSKSVTEMAIRTILKISEDYRKQSYKSRDLNKESTDILLNRKPIQRNRRPDPNAYRHGYLKDPVDGIWKPTHIVNGRKEAGEEIDSFFRGRGHKHWNIKDLEKQIDDRISRLGTRTIPKGTVWETRYRHKDYWDSRKGGSTGNTGPK